VSRRLAALSALPLLSLSLAACGSASGGEHSSASSGATFTSAGSSTTAASIVGRSCPAQVANALGEVAGRIYHEASSGADVAEAVHRVQSSSALAQAISSDDASGAGAALRALQAGQIVRIEIVKGSRVFASAGSGQAIAPVRGPIAGADARFVLSTQADEAFTQVTRQVTGADVLLLAGAKPAASRARPIASTLAGSALPAEIPASGELEYEQRKYEVTSLAGALYPAGALRIALLVPSAGAHCPALGEQTRIETLGHVGERIYQEEARSSYVQATVRHIEADTSFQQAVANRDLPAIRTAIVSFFAAHIHVVRVRVYAVEPSGAQRFLYDLGGPYVLAPVHGAVRSAGKLVGRFSMAIQDDAGYVKLAHRFTGADVLMRRGTTQVIGTLDPGPAHVPDRGKLEYAGKRYEAYSFTGEAFPSGPLRISLLVPSRKPADG
jgi:hypothetical protein